MATQDMMGLFGATPEEIRRQRMQQEMQTPMLSTDPRAFIAQVGTGMGTQLAGLARDVGGMFGFRSAEEEQAMQRQQALTQAQEEGATGSALYQALAKQLSAAGDTRGAFMAAEKAREMAQQEEAAQVGLALKKAQLEEAQAKAKADPRAARVQELLKTGKYTPESVAAFEKTGKPTDLEFKPDKVDSPKIIKLLDAQGITVANGKGDQRNKILAAAIERETKGDPAQLAQLKLLQAQTELQLAQSKLREKELEIERGRKADVLKNTLTKTDTAETITFINAARKVINENPTLASGIPGQLLRATGIEATPAGILDARYETIRAKIGFRELQSMREASPTGGALGSITERELGFLQAVRGKLSVGLPKEVQLAALDQIEKSLSVLAYIKDKTEKNEKIPDDFIKRFYPDGVPSIEQVLSRVGEGSRDTSSGTVQTPAAPAVTGRKPLSAF